MIAPSTAFHQAGHAVVAVRLGIPVTAVTAREARDSYGECDHGLGPLPEQVDADRWESLAIRAAAVIIAQAGLASAQRHAADAAMCADPVAAPTDGDAAGQSPVHLRQDGDHDEVLRHAQALCVDDDERPAFYQWSDMHVGAIIDRSWKDIQLVAEALQSKGRLDGDELRQMLGARP